jgi:hypothetical protein
MYGPAATRLLLSSLSAIYGPLSVVWRPLLLLPNPDSSRRPPEMTKIAFEVFGRLLLGISVNLCGGPSPLLPPL